MSQNLLIKNGRPVGNGYDGNSELDIRIQNGTITEIGENLDQNGDEELFDAAGAYISGGWMDMHVHFREPGFEHKETIETGCRAAAFGGFTEVACMPNTKPATHTRDVVEYIRKKAEGEAVSVHPIGCVTKDRAGKSIAEMADMKKGGAVAFSDDGDPVFNSHVMRVALEYSSMLGMPIINHEEDLDLSRPGHMNEGEVSTRLGLDGTPGIAEETMIARDILLAGFTGGHIHVAHISTRKAVDLVRQAKKEGINVTTEVCAHHFDLTDIEIEKRGFDTNVKMHPPLRTQDDVDAMIEGLADGTIDVICTDHAPHAIEEKEAEFIYAPNGIIGLETAWSITVKRLVEPGVLTINQVLDKLVIKPREILNLEIPEIAEGKKANLTIFNTDEKWTFSPSEVRSKSRNSPYLNQQMTGRAVAIFNNNRLVENTIGG
ncbi:dihydroorotase [Rhodohalobacter sp. SW132]|uniref:dihydroorotase n=1 Tax=Rhodohalobacter sp. SW132 TaxID=2293433 RepID=UPI0018F3BFE7|nr:dihydroorotase [Rhodohalobacter sp. SW132]